MVAVSSPEMKIASNKLAQIQDNGRQSKAGNPTQTVPSDRNTLHNPTKKRPI
jgi:hypothetical protein